jgi:hypothetical protein
MEHTIEVYRSDYYLNTFRKYTQELHLSILNLWSNQTYKNYFIKNYQKLHIPEGTLFLLNKLSKIPFISNYGMDYNDLLRAKERSLGTQEHEFRYNHENISLVDVCGLRAERKVFLN